MGPGPGAEEEQEVLTGGMGRRTCGLFQPLFIAAGETEAKRRQSQVCDCSSPEPTALNTSFEAHALDVDNCLAQDHKEEGVTSQEPRVLTPQDPSPFPRRPSSQGLEEGVEAGSEGRSHSPEASHHLVNKRQALWK